MNLICGCPILFVGGPFLFGATSEDIAISEETGEMSDALAAYFTYGTALIVVGMLIFPMWQCFYYRFVANRTRLGASKFSIQVRIRSFYAIYLAMLGLAFIGGALFFLAINMLTGVLVTEDEINFGAFAFLYVVLIAIYVCIFAFLKTAITNLVYSNIKLADASFNSTLKFTDMAALYLTNSIAIVLTLGMAIPWAKIRLARYRAANIVMLAEQEPAVLRAEGHDVDASADAMTDLFDLDIGL